MVSTRANTESLIKLNLSNSRLIQFMPGCPLEMALLAEMSSIVGVEISIASEDTRASNRLKIVTSFIGIFNGQV
jgi:hypothetical protein